MARSTLEEEPSGSPNIPLVRVQVFFLLIGVKWLFKVKALSAAVTFGIFSVLSWTAADGARAQANTANVLALAALCANVADEVSRIRCSGVGR